METSDRDCTRRIFDIRLSTTTDPHELKMLCYLDALLLNEDGLDPRPMLEESRAAELEQYRRSGLVRHVVIIAGDRACEACFRLNGVRFGIEDALRTRPLPCRRCTRILHRGSYGFCRCWYAAEVA